MAETNNVHNALEILNIAENFYLLSFYQCYQMNIFVELILAAKVLLEIGVTLIELPTILVQLILLNQF